MNILKDHNKNKGNRGEGTMSKFLKIIISAILVLLITACLFSTYGSNNYVYEDDSVYGVNGKVKLEKAKTVTVIENTNWYGYENCIPILEQPNVWCVQKGVNLGNEYSPEVTYGVGETFEITDPVLKYIIAKGSQGKTALEKSYKTESQNALWRYLAGGHKHDNKKKILENISCGSVETTKGKELYKKALKCKESDVKNIKVECRILKNSKNKNQRLIVTKVTDAPIPDPDPGPDPIPETPKYSISLEKFITQVNGKTIYNTTHDLNGDGFVDNKDVKYLQNIIAGNISLKDIENFSMVDVTTMQKIAANLHTPTETEKKIYDLNGDGIINQADVTYMQRIIANLIEINDVTEEISIFDINNDGTINMYDVVELQQWISKNTREYKRYNKDAKTDLEENKNVYKYDNPVEVGLGDEITYTFKLKNTGDAPITVNYIEDVPEIKNNVKLTYVKQHLRGIDVDYEVKEVTTENGKLKVVFDSPAEIDVGGEVYVDLIFKTEPLPNTSLNTDEVKKLENKASVTINGLTPGEDFDGAENNSDSDFIKVKKAAVSLEKFVSKVNNTNIYIDDSDEPFILQSFDANDDDRVDIQDYELIILYMKGKEVDSRVKERIEREGMAEYLEELQNVFVRQGIVGSDAILGNREPIDPSNFNRRYNDLLRNNNSGNLNTWKKDNPVRVDTGDSVTYTIRIRNTGNTNIKVDTIKDIPDSRLEYSSVSNGKYNNGTITLTNAISLKPGEYKDINITFEVNGQTNSDTDYIKNTAYIEEIKNEAGIVVPDCDGTDNNRDCDFIKTIDIYKVSLEKYVSEVTDKKGNKVKYSRDGKAEYLYQVSNDQFVDETNEKSTWSQNNNYKEKNPVEVETGDLVTYTIKVTNKGDTEVNISSITDYLPNGVNFVESPNLSYNNDKNTFSPLQRNSLSSGDSIYFKVTVEVTENSPGKILKNTAQITNDKLNNYKNIEVTDTTLADNKDSDYIKIKQYKVSLEKYVSKVNNVAVDDDRDGDDLNPNADKSEHKYDNKGIVQRNWKYNNPVPVSKGDKVTYTIKVKNDGDTFVKITNITDYLPNGVKYRSTEYKSSKDQNGKLIYSTEFKDKNGQTNNKIQFTGGISLQPHESHTFDVEVEVIENNISVNILKNVAEIIYIENKNGCSVADVTDKNNKDSDYIQMKDITIAGMVWNDIAIDKMQNYNGKYDSGTDQLLNGISVVLHRVNDNKEYTYTTSNGYYEFSGDYYIKGPKEEDTNRWAGTYYSYYVKFEYDGIKYTSPECIEVGGVEDTDNVSNAAEDKNERKKFNDKFSTINNGTTVDGKKIEYEKHNDNGYIPESNYKYNSSMAMHSYTITIDLKKDVDLEKQMKHINLGLRGRDIFDLSLISDVFKTRVTVNGQSGGYNYNNNVTLRQGDLSDVVSTSTRVRRGTSITSSKPRQDTANTYLNRESNNQKGEYNQYIRESDADINKTKANKEKYLETGLSIEVTYKITVRNESLTAGKATQIIDFYDSRYTFVGAYSDSERNNVLPIKEETTNSKLYNGVIIYPNGKMLQQGETMEVYLTFKLNDASKSDLAKLKNEERLPTFNMAEIYEYKTECGEGQTEYIRGLIDKDSAPGSAKSEKVSLKEGATSDYSTLDYYFSKKTDSNTDLRILKYEDDTYATPVLYFVASDKLRTIEGTIFEDKTITDSKTHIKTGNGKLDEGEVGVYGATVELIEQIDDGKVRYTTTTGTDGKYLFEGFLPGNYIIRYRYGDTEETVILGKAVKESDNEGNITKLINAKSYNGEDFQSTNNTGKAGGEVLERVGKLSDRQNFWYLDNEDQGVSTATDNSTRRGEVTTYMTGENSDIKMRVLNNIRDGKDSENAKVEYEAGKFITVNDIIGGTNMFADTPRMKFNVEKVDDDHTENMSFGTYEIKNMNFGIAEVPVTKVDLQKHIKEFKIVDSTGKNTLAGYKDGKAIGNVLRAQNSNIDVSIEDNLLQGATLTVTFEITQNITEEFNFDTAVKNPTKTEIKALVDFVDNNLSYNQTLGNNSDNWEVVQNVEGTSIDPNSYRVILKATENNPIINGRESVTVTLEKVLSSPDITLAQIITSLTEDDVYNYRNTVEVTELETNAQRDRVRTNEDRYIFLIGQPSATTTSEELVIHPPTGSNSINTTYFMLAAVCLGILVAGVYCIKRFVLTNEKS